MPHHCVYITSDPSDPVPAAVGERRTRRAGDVLIVYCADRADAEALRQAIPGSTYGETITLNPWGPRGSGGVTEY